MTGQLIFNGLTDYIAKDGNGGLIYRLGAFKTDKQVVQFARYPETFIIDHKTGIAQHMVRIQIIQDSPASADERRLAWEALQRGDPASITITHSSGGGSITRANCELMNVVASEPRTYMTTTGTISKTVIDIELEFIQCSET